MDKKRIHWLGIRKGAIELDMQQLVDAIAEMANTIEKEKDYLTQLDNEIGDGDHGINMARGFHAVIEKLPSLQGGDIGGLLKGGRDATRFYCRWCIRPLVWNSFHESRYGLQGIDIHRWTGLF